MSIVSRREGRTSLRYPASCQAICTEARHSLPAFAVRSSNAGAQMGTSAAEHDGVAHRHKIQTNPPVFPRARAGLRCSSRMPYPIGGPEDVASRRHLFGPQPYLDAVLLTCSMSARDQPPAATDPVPSTAPAHLLQSARFGADAEPNSPHLLRLPP